MQAKYLFLNFFIFNFSFLTTAQNSDSLKSVNLKELEIFEKNINSIEKLPDLKDGVIYAGKKTDVINLNKSFADLSTNISRQIFSKIPGINVWENDGSGIQQSISTRGLSPNRSWEFNVRQNGYDISAEPFGYPESYYTPPSEAVEKIEIIRGAASLQFGPQFGGLINYQIKKGDTQKPVSVKSSQTIGSYNLFNTFNSVGGTINKINYYAYFHHRNSNGWRENSYYKTNSAYASLSYKISKKATVEGEYTNMDYLSQQPGGLSDIQFKQNAQQSSRSRNWFSAPWNLASINLKFQFSESLKINAKVFSTFAQRNSVGYLKSINLSDSINANTLAFSPRQVDREYYKNYGTEIRLSKESSLGKIKSILSAGIRLFKGSTNRNQLGIGSKEIQYNLFVDGPYGRSLNFGTDNASIFAENIFYLSKKVKIIPGIRMEYLESCAKGYINTTSTGNLGSQTKVRKFLLYGIGAEYSITQNTKFYGNYSLAYRPITFSELTPSATTEIIDPNLKDANGFNVDFGYMGSLGTIISFNVSGFYLQYNNRIGSIPVSGGLFKTNIGTSESKGIESFIELNPVNIIPNNTRFGRISLFASNTFINATYTKWNNTSIANDPTKSIENKRVENAPNFIHRFGFTYNRNKFYTTFQLSKVGDVFTDATNSELPNSTYTIGKLNGYVVMDISAIYKISSRYNLKAGVNNLSDTMYATRRATGYPGPGIMPANGRTIFVTFEINL